MPATAPAAFSRIGRRMSLSPAMSVTLYIIVTSASCTNELTSPAAIVLTRSFGNPSGSARKTPAASADPPDPPRETSPWMACADAREARRAPARAETVVMRSLRDEKAGPCVPLAAARGPGVARTLGCWTSMAGWVLGVRPTSTSLTRTRWASRSWARTYRSSSSLVSHVPRSATQGVSSAGGGCSAVGSIVYVESLYANVYKLLEFVYYKLACGVLVRGACTGCGATGFWAFICTMEPA
ncbi:hypothetical protein GSI_11627 [Ganoderma sinense ZZ0214-1]|uniref:Uncharacterized protein n=1 Tax=Ganoderma sinense ZZ0214-1 TaxID=1077348 RepID=A0A2G8RWL1_9APHY|nr:hypothetical protein GSI_11627 [Ganoderma sinense ZZ0214-1]